MMQKPLPKTFHLLASLVFAHSWTANAREPKLNEVQVIGSHNSYHLAPPSKFLSTIETFNRDAALWNYSHPPLDQQFQLGIRQFELDLFADPAGTLFRSPLAHKLSKLRDPQTPAFDPDKLLHQPGFKVLHVPDIDCWSNAPTLEIALRQLRDQSLRNPRHFPLMILLECKDKSHPPLPTKPLTFSRDLLLELEKAVLQIWPRHAIYTPDDRRGNTPTLRQAVTSTPWPDVDSLRGKILFMIDNTDAIRDRYLESNPSLEGRLFWVSAPSPQHPAAGWFKCNDAIGDFEQIRQLTQQGFLVRTRSDTGRPSEKRTSKAFESGAQWISTDQFKPDSKPRVQFDDGTFLRIRPQLKDQGNLRTPHP